jgi:hypothetical protein
MKTTGLLLSFLLLLSFNSCKQDNIRIIELSETRVGQHSAGELERYLNQIYEDVSFQYLSREDPSIDDAPARSILLLLSSQAGQLKGMEGALPTLRESFKIKVHDKKLLVIAPDERGLLNAVYALLEKLGCGFYISGDALPDPAKWDGFTGWEMQDEPLAEERFVFNWHNFLSGCTGWNLPDWQGWIDQANKMRYNGIMVHAYGNNPMFSFEYLGEKKKTGYLNNTISGRDWGNQHINDVRRMTGGEIFDEAVFGAAASKAAEGDKDQAATELMQQVFRYAEDRGTKVIFALDFDTWMANPRNILEKLPEEAVFTLTGGHLAPNPEHPAGYAYLKHLIESFVRTYPDVDQLSVWHRSPGSSLSIGTIWINFPYDKFPVSWKEAYDARIGKYPDIEDDIKAQGMFAHGKLIAAILKIRDEVKPELEISSGSWRMEYIRYADAFFPQEVPLLPLDWSIVFDTPEVKEILSGAAEHRKIYPVIWAHHDDHRYIGRPYRPWPDLADKLAERKASGFGIIHWTTRPLDLYFTNSARQVWKSTLNENIETTVTSYVSSLFGSTHEEVIEYVNDWMSTGPMFGRETSDHFIDLGMQHSGEKLESWEDMRSAAGRRLERLNSIPEDENSRYLEYQKGMEEFYISFFDNQILFQQAFQLARELKIDEAVEIMKQTDPEQSIQKYADAIKNLGFTSGEMALVFSMNTRWLADYKNLEQHLGMSPVRFRFAPTFHDPLAQQPGKYSYYIDDGGHWWNCLWENELENRSFFQENGRTALAAGKDFEFNLQTWHGQTLSAGEYRIELLTLGEADRNDIVLSLRTGGAEHLIEKSGIQVDPAGISFNLLIEKGATLNMQSESGGIYLTGLTIEKI